MKVKTVKPESVASVPVEPEMAQNTSLEPPAIRHPFFSLQLIEPALGPVARLYDEAKKNTWPKPVKMGDTIVQRRHKILGMPTRIKLRSNDLVDLHDWIVKVVTKLLSLTGFFAVGEDLKSTVRKTLLNLFYFEDVSTSLAEVTNLVEEFGGRKMWAKCYTAEDLQKHRQTPCWTLEDLFNGMSRLEIAKLFEERTGVRVLLD
jgi:hypothetical protein